MFYNCSYLGVLNLSNFDTSKVRDMSYMFYHCSHLDTLNLSNFNTSKVANMSNMFNKCFDLIKLDISNFIIKDNTRIKYMLSNCNINLQNKIKNQFKNIKDIAFEKEEQIDEPTLFNDNASSVLNISRENLGEDELLWNDIN